MSKDTSLVLDPAEEVVDSVVFMPIASSLVRQLAQVSSPTTSLVSESSPKDDKLEQRRYSDVSQESIQDVLPDTSSMVLKWNNRVHQFDARRGTSNLSRNLDRQVPLHTFNRHPNRTSYLSGSRLIRRGSEPLKPTTNSQLSPPNYDRIRSTSTTEPRRYEFYRTGAETNQDFCSTPYFPIQPAKPQPIRPTVQTENQKGKLSSFFSKLLSNKKPKRARRRKDNTNAANSAALPTAEESREHGRSRLELRHRLRRSERVSSVGIEGRSGPVGPTMSTASETRNNIRGNGRRTSSMAKFSRYASSDCPSEALSMPLPGVNYQQNFRKRVSESHVAKRNRVGFVTEGSSISSCSDRDEDTANAKMECNQYSKTTDMLKRVQERNL